ncbi:hypothetical protein MMC07_007276 [Pseudocyphellaria aurata]|nr:hypothetical protein [Pseudocyphellaria aurata]
MKLLGLLLCVVLCISTPPVTAFPQLLPRGGDEINWGQMAQGSWNFVTGAFAAGVGALGSAWNAGVNLFQSPQSTDTATLQQNPDTSTTETDSSTTQQDPQQETQQDTQQDTNSLGQLNNDKLDVPVTPSAEINLEVIGEKDRNDPCYPSHTNNPECDGRPLDRIVLTSICENLASSQIQITEAIKSRNALIERTLTGIDTLNKGKGYSGPGVRKSQSNAYDVLFFLVPLTDNQVDDVNSLDGVYAVEFRQKLINSNDPESAPDLRENPQMPVKIQMRNPELPDPNETPPPFTPPLFTPNSNVETQLGVYPDLGFISTPTGKETAHAYDYDISAGAGVVVWVINSGVEPHADFHIESYHFALGAIQRRSDDFGWGTCYASKIVGLYGVAKRARLKVMKIGDWVDSIADGLKAILDAIKDAIKDPVLDTPVGFTVIALDQTWIPMGGKQSKLIEDLITELERDFKVPIVVTGGNDERDRETQSQTDDLIVNALPGIWSATHPLIVVGAVNPLDGKRYPWTRGGSIFAPGNVQCSNIFKPGSNQIAVGTRYAAAQVAGLLAYLLSSAQYGDQLRSDLDGVPLAIKTKILNLGYIRVGAKVISIWNGLDSTLKPFQKFWR